MVKKGSFRFSPLLAVAPVLIIFIVFSILPVIVNIIISFTDFNGDIFAKIHWIGLRNYKSAFTSMSEYIINAIKLTLIYAFSLTLIQNFIAIFTAVLLNMNLKLRNIFRSAVFLPSMFSAVVLGLAWTLVFDPYSGPVSVLLNYFGINSALLGDENIAMFLVIFVSIWATYGYASVLYLAGLQKIPKEIYESANIDGANNVNIFRYITIPYLMPVISVNILLSLIGSLKSYDFILVLTNGGPGDSTSTLSMYLFRELTKAVKTQSFVSTLQVILFVIVFIFVVITQYLLSKKEESLI